MTEHDAADHSSGTLDSRRGVMKKAGIAAAGAWVAPMVVLSSSASAQVSGVTGQFVNISQTCGSNDGGNSGVFSADVVLVGIALADTHVVVEFSSDCSAFGFQSCNDGAGVVASSLGNYVDGGENQVRYTLRAGTCAAPGAELDQITSIPCCP